MTTESIIAICAIVLAKPIEIIWNKIFQTKIKFKPKFKRTSHIIIGYLLPFILMFFIYHFVTFGKLFAILVGLNVFNFLTTLILDLIGMHRNRISLLEIEVGKLRNEIIRLTQF